MPPLLEDPVQSLLARLTGGSPRVLIALAGLPGAGKSTLATRLAAEVTAVAGPGAMVVLGMDGFHLTQAALRRMPDPEAAFARRGAPWTFDVPALTARVRTLQDAAGREPVPWPDFRHETGDPVEGALLVGPETRLVLVEGLYLLCRSDGWEAVSRLFDERWYLDTPLEVALTRLAARHRAAWGLTREAAEARIAANDRFNAEIVAESCDFADWRLAN